MCSKYSWGTWGRSSRFFIILLFIFFQLQNKNKTKPHRNEDGVGFLAGRKGKFVLLSVYYFAGLPRHQQLLPACWLLWAEHKPLSLQRAEALPSKKVQKQNAGSKSYEMLIREMFTGVWNQQVLPLILAYGSNSYFGAIWHFLPHGWLDWALL